MLVPRTRLLETPVRVVEAAYKWEWQQAGEQTQSVRSSEGSIGSRYSPRTTPSRPVGMQRVLGQPSNIKGWSGGVVRSGARREEIYAS